MGEFQAHEYGVLYVKEEKQINMGKLWKNNNELGILNFGFCERLVLKPLHLVSCLIFLDSSSNRNFDFLIA